LTLIYQNNLKNKILILLKTPFLLKKKTISELLNLAKDKKAKEISVKNIPQQMDSSLLSPLTRRGKKRVKRLFSSKKRWIWWVNRSLPPPFPSFTFKQKRKTSPYFLFFNIERRERKSLYHLFQPVDSLSFNSKAQFTQQTKCTSSSGNVSVPLLL